MADGGDGYFVLAGIKNRTIDVVDLEAFVNYIKANGVVNPKIEGRVTKLN